MRYEFVQLSRSGVHVCLLSLDAIMPASTSFPVPRTPEAWNALLLDRYHGGDERVLLVLVAERLVLALDAPQLAPGVETE